MPEEYRATLLWLGKTSRPVEGARPEAHQGGEFQKLSQAIEAYRDQRDEMKEQGKLPWIKPHGAGGAPWLNEPQIKAFLRTLEAEDII